MGTVGDDQESGIARKLKAVYSRFAGALQPLVDTFQQQWMRLSRMVVVVGIPATILYLCNGHSPPGSIWHNAAFVSAFQVRGLHCRTSLAGVAAAWIVVACSHSAAPAPRTRLLLSSMQQGMCVQTVSCLLQGVPRCLGMCTGMCLHPLCASQSSYHRDGLSQGPSARL